MEHVMHLTDANFEEVVLASDVPVLVDFWASWCPPCKMMEPVIRELAEAYDGQVRIGKMNVDRNPKTASLYRIKGVPAFTLFCSGEIVLQRTGAQSRDQIQRMIQGCLPLTVGDEMQPGFAAG